MKHLLTAICLVSFATPVIAQDALFTAPGGAVVQMDIETCPQNMISVDAFIKNGDANLEHIRRGLNRCWGDMTFRF